MIDIHSHIISDVDDGSKSIEMTINMLKVAEESGTTEIIATPHFMRGKFEVDYSEIVNKVEELNKIAEKEKLKVKIYHGQEVFYSSKILRYYLDNNIGTINNSKYMLIELPRIDFDLDEVINNIYELQIRGIVPIIAHPERYKPFIKNPSSINKFIEEGYLFQVNSGSITGKFGREVKKTTTRYLKNNIYSFIGSDAHRDINRNTDMRSALELLNDDIKKSFEKNSKALITNEDIEFIGQKIKEKKKLFAIFG